MKTAIVLGAAVLALFGVTGCSGDDGVAAPAPTPTASASAAPTVPGDGRAITPAGEESPRVAPGEPPALVPPGGAPELVPAPPNEAPDIAPGEPDPTRDDATVDARDYQSGKYYFFQSPSGNIMCGFVYDGELGTGCQLAEATVIPAELPDCGTRPDRAVAAQVNGAQARYLCLNQGVFVGPPPDGSSGKGGGKVLNYGDTIIVRGVACTSLESGVRCTEGGHGFMIAADAQSLF
ncbi:hypothetical protein [Nocardia callitridis]|uniref:Lipoprotein n=1 Tax=Nocardia callitridis TaxID=648753 RepID=A0ABP9L661_9NOCA